MHPYLPRNIPEAILPLPPHRFRHDALLAAGGGSTLKDGTGELRLTWRQDFLDNFSVTAHYENLVSGGDSRSQQQKILKSLPWLSGAAFFDDGVPEDDRRLFDLTGQLDEDDNRIWYHRMDRIFLSWRSGPVDSLGKRYAAAMIQFEAHPLVNLYLTGVVNLNDPSGVLLPRLNYDITRNGQITLGGNLNFGGHDTEYGGWDIPYTGLESAPPDSVYLRITRFF